jgi:hypothetical protein
LWWDDIRVRQGDGPSNTVPLLELSPPGSPGSVRVGEDVRVDVIAFEYAADRADTIRLWATNLPAAGQFEAREGTGPLTNTFRWTPAVAGSHTVTFCAADKDGTNSLELGIEAVELSPDVLWINELHYDNDGSDTDQGVEVAGRSGVNLADYHLYFYDEDGEEDVGDRLTNLAGTIGNEGRRFGAQWIATDLENESEGIALARIAAGSTDVVQFLSYEGTITAVDGPARGIASADIGVNESGSETKGLSLQLTGRGRRYADFGWSGPSNATPGILNAGQTVRLLPSVLFVQ